MRLDRGAWRAGVVGCLMLGASWSALVHGQGLDCRVQECRLEDLKDALRPPQLRALNVVDAQRNRSMESSSVTINVNFLEGSGTILPDFYSELNKLGELLTEPGLQEMRLQIDGHTDNTGSEVYNDALSLRRARSVKQYLVENFPIRPERLLVQGYGKRHPATTNDTLEGRWKNRRVEVKALE